MNSGCSGCCASLPFPGDGNCQVQVENVQVAAQGFHSPFTGSICIVVNLCYKAPPCTSTCGNLIIPDGPTGGTGGSFGFMFLCAKQTTVVTPVPPPPVLPPSYSQVFSNSDLAAFTVLSSSPTTVKVSVCFQVVANIIQSADFGETPTGIDVTLPWSFSFQYWWSSPCPQSCP